MHYLIRFNSFPPKGGPFGPPTVKFCQYLWELFNPPEFFWLFLTFIWDQYVNFFNFVKIAHIEHYTFFFQTLTQKILFLYVSEYFCKSISLNSQLPSNVRLIIIFTIMYFNYSLSLEKIITGFPCKLLCNVRNSDW